jgi:hypothetical protein
MIFSLMAILVAAPLDVPDCPIDRAVYRLNGAPGFTAGFLRQDRRKVMASDLVFWLKTPKRTWFFAFSSPNGYGGTYISPDIDPRLAVRMTDDEEPPFIPFDAFGPDLKAYEGPPGSTMPAPARLFARGLGPSLWYESVTLAGNDPKAEQESMPIGMFEPAGCGGGP